MPEAEDDIVVNVEDKAQPGTEPETVANTEPQQPDPAVAELKAQFEELQRAKADSDRRAQEASRQAGMARAEAEAARGQVADREADSIASGLSAAEAEAEAAQQAYAAAMEAGNFTDAAKAQRRMARAEAESVRLTEAKASLETRKVTSPEPARQPPPEQTDPVEAFIAQRTEPTQRWLRQHKDWITDPKKNARLTSAHYSAVAEGLTADTDEYFEHVETQIGLRQPRNADGTFAPTNGAAKPAARKSAPPAAPVVQSGGGTSGGSNEVRLSKTEAQAAQDGTLVWNYDDPSGQKRFKKGDPIGIQEFARRKREMQRQGLYDRSFTEQ